MCKPPQLLTTEQHEENENPYTSLTKAKQNLSKGTLYASISLITLISAFSLLMPFAQSRRDELQCDTLCQGSMTSVRSTLALIGSALMGRLSDQKRVSFLGRGILNGRMVCLYIGTFATLVGFVISGLMYSVRGMWLGMIPGALLQQNFSIYKALLADYHEEITQWEQKIQSNSKKDDGDGENDEIEGTQEETKQSSSSKNAAAAAARAGSVGKLGMSVGLSFMVGPLIGATLIKTYQSAIIVSSLLTILSAVWIIKMPIPFTTLSSSDVGDDDNQKMKPKVNNLSSTSSWRRSVIDMINVKAAKTKPALLLMTIRLSMALAFHIFNLIWTVSLKQRFDFGPSDHGKFMSYIGLVFALSQGFLAKRILSFFDNHHKSKNHNNSNKGRVYVILTCCLALGVGRVIAFQVNDLRIVYIMFGLIVTSLGVVNTVLTADTCLIAPSSEIGGIYGVLEAAQSAAGMFGPFIGGLLAKIHPVNAPLAAVVGLYVFVFVLVLFGYEKLILNNDRSVKEQEYDMTKVEDLRKKKDL